MDSDHFDALARSLYDRRRVVTRAAGFGAATLAAAFGLGHPHEASATCKKKCGPCKRCKKGKCKPKPVGTACAGGTCQSGRCIASTQPCTPNCAGKICGDNGCGGSCGTCGIGGGCTGGGCICADRTCSGGTCAADKLTCCPEDANEAPCTGSTTDTCVCLTTTEGTKRCHGGGQVDCTTVGACTSSATCPTGTFCSDTLDFCQGFCVRDCAGVA
jgi:hypothetical protein